MITVLPLSRLQVFSFAFADLLVILNLLSGLSKSDDYEALMKAFLWQQMGLSTDNILNSMLSPSWMMLYVPSLMLRRNP